MQSQPARHTAWEHERALQQSGRAWTSAALGVDRAASLFTAATESQTPGGNFQAGQGRTARAWCSLDLPFSQNLQLGIIINQVTWEFTQ